MLLPTHLDLPGTFGRPQLPSGVVPLPRRSSAFNTLLNLWPVVVSFTEREEGGQSQVLSYGLAAPSPGF